ncbi:hypothetical protein [Granulicella sp. L46]|jgi:hypothetical protein|uniref:hypothetical protein n=1 Tax=Granulicella sp. L46 TaxID=1641865 RepID=UPI00131EC5AD|nr:hypothetical protein [Granulicella sp. L46]
MTERKTRARARAEATTKARATTKANMGVFRFAQDDGEKLATTKAKATRKATATTTAKAMANSSIGRSGRR